MINLSLFLLMYFNQLNVKKTLQANYFPKIKARTLLSIRGHWMICLLFFFFTDFFFSLCTLSLTLFFYSRLVVLVRERESLRDKWPLFHNLNRSVVVVELIQWLSVATALLIPTGIYIDGPSMRAFYYGSFYSAVFFFNANFHVENFIHFNDIKNMK